MKKYVLSLMLISVCQASFSQEFQGQTLGADSELQTFPIRGVVYDVGLMYGGETLSLPDFNPEQVDYDMNVISNILSCNAVRIEGDNLARLVKAAEIAGSYKLKVFFNPWKMEAGPEEVVEYMRKGAEEAERLRERGLDIVFVAGCEYSMFNKGVIDGDTQNERMNALMELGASGESRAKAQEVLDGMSAKLNAILGIISKNVREAFKGEVTYASGTWESVDWSNFDIVGVDYYRNGESESDYVQGLERYRSEGKPIVVMEMGCCTYKGAAQRGSFAFAIYKGIDGQGNAIYENGVVPIRDETEQADYVETVIRLLSPAGIGGVFVFVFRYPIYPYKPDGIDLDMTSYALVKSFPPEDSHSKRIPSWQPKEAFFRLGKIYTRQASREPLE